MAESRARDLSRIASRSGGATGGGGDQVFNENDQVVSTDYTLSASANAVTAGRGAVLIANNNAAAYVDFSAEL